MDQATPTDQPGDHELKIPHTSSPGLDSVLPSELPNEQPFAIWLQKRGGYKRLPDEVLRKLYTTYSNEVKIQAEQELNRRHLFGPDGKFIVFTPPDAAEDSSSVTEIQLSSPPDALPATGTIIVPHDE